MQASLERLATHRGSLIETGIKALDLFAPLPRGALVRVPFMAGVGMVVLLGELCHRFIEPKRAAIWTGFTQRPFDVSDWEADMSEFGLAGRVQSSLVGFDEPSAARREAFERGLHTCETLRDAGQDVLAVVLSAAGFENDVEASLPRLAAPAATGSITSIVVSPFPENPDLPKSLPAPYSAQITLDRARARHYLFPALQPRLSLSAALDPSLVGERHVAVAGKARQLLEAYESLDPGFESLDEAPADDAPERSKARQLLRYLCQPCRTTEPFTGRSGEVVPIGELLDAVERIVAA
jgi:F-type H+-transporting ATPase subunit beta